MSAIIKLRKTTIENLEYLSQTLIAKLNDFGAEVVHQENHDNVLLLVFERYFLRNGNYAALTIQCVDNGTDQYVTIIGTGGGGGILNVSWGANEDFAVRACDILEKIGFIKI